MTDTKKIVGELILPPAKHKLSTYLANNLYRILPVLPQERGAMQMFASNLIIACNELSGDAKVSPESVLLAAFNSARIGLMPGAVLGLCYFVPRKGQCCLDIGYQGYIDLATSNDFLKNLYADVVLNEEIEDGTFFHGVRAMADGPRQMIEHAPRPNRDLDEKTLRQRVGGAYCIYETAKGGISFRFLNRVQLDKADLTVTDPQNHRKHYSLKHYYEWCMKTVIRRASKLWKKSRELAWAVNMDDMLEIGMDQNALGALPDADGEPDEFSLGDIKPEDQSKPEDKEAE